MDTNKDGVINFEEFKQWHFGGMKKGSENAVKVARARLGQIAKRLGDEKLLAEIQADPSMTHQKLRLTFNHSAMKDVGTDLLFRVNLFGRQYEQFLAAARAFTSGWKEGRRMGYVSVEVEAPQAELDAFKPRIDDFFKNCIGSGP